MSKEEIKYSKYQLWIVKRFLERKWLFPKQEREANELIAKHLKLLSE